MAPDLKRIGRKAKELEPLNLRRLRKKQSNSILRKKVGLRKRLKRDDMEDEEEDERDDERRSMREFLRDGASAARA